MSKKLDEKFGIKFFDDTRDKAYEQGYFQHMIAKVLGISQPELSLSPLKSHI